MLPIHWHTKKNRYNLNKKVEDFFFGKWQKMFNAHFSALLSNFWSIGQLCFILQPPQIELLGGFPSLSHTWKHLPFSILMSRETKNKVSAGLFRTQKEISCFAHLHSHRRPKILFLLSWKIQFILKRTFKKSTAAMLQLHDSDVCYYFWSIEYRAVQKMGQLLSRLFLGLVY